MCFIKNLKNQNVVCIGTRTSGKGLYILEVECLLEEVCPLKDDKELDRTLL